MNIKEVILRISQIRSNANLSARKLSLDIGKNSAYISRLESSDDSFEPSVSALLEIIDACGITPAQFFYDKVDEYKSDMELLDLLKTDKDLLALIKNADKNKKQAIIDLLKN